MVFGALGVTGFGGNERGRLFGLAPRHPLYLVSLPTRPSPIRVNSVCWWNGEGVKYRRVGLTQG